MNEILIDKFETLPLDIQRLMPNNINDMKEYNTMFYTGNLSHELEEMLDNISEYFEEHNPYIITFHATRLFEFEIKDINSNGYKVPTENSIKNRLKIACKFMEFNGAVFDSLQQCCSLKTQNPHSKFYSVATISSLSDFGFTDLYNYWGGESIYMRSKKINEKVFESIADHTIPCLFVGRVKYKDIDYKSWLPNKIIKCYIKQKMDIEMTDSDGFEFTTSATPQVIKVVRYDDKDFISYVGESLYKRIIKPKQSRLEMANKRRIK